MDMRHAMYGLEYGSMYFPNVSIRTKMVAVGAATV